ARQILLGGVEVGQNTLIRFYTLHIALLPTLLVLLVSVHLWRVRKDGGLAISDQSSVDSIQ
ncbi:MAG: cytochrome b N-terminal domain-containing protein, partial [Anaerolineales bacterium]